MPNPTQPTEPAVTPDTLPVDPPAATSEPTAPPEATKTPDAATAALASDAEFQDGFDAALSDQPPEPKPEGAKPEEAPKPEAAKPAEAPKEEPKPEPTDAEKAEAARKAEVDKEASALNLKDKAKDRFHQLNDTIAKQAPLVEVLDKAGVKDVAALEQMVGNAQAAVQIVGMVKETGANPEQYVMALDYLAEANKAMAGDVQAAQKCWDWMASEMKTLAPLLGKEVPGVVDPLEAHPDLLKDVDGGDITRARALEIAAARSRGAIQDGAKKAQADAQAQQTAQAEAITKAKADLTALGNELAGTTAQSQALYQRLAPALVEGVKEISRTLPPGQWSAAVRVLYNNLARVAATQPAPTPAPEPAKAAGNLGPSRAAGPTPHLSKATFADPLDALEAGIAAANAGS